MTLFARDFTATTVGMITNIFFDLKSLLSVVIGLFGLYLATKKVETIKNRITGITLSLAGGALAYYFVSQYPEVNNIQPETFQHFNPLFIVFLTPVIMGVITSYSIHYTKLYERFLKSIWDLKSPNKLSRL